MILPVSENFSEYGKEVTDKIRDAGLRVHLDDRNETLGYRIREGQKEKIPYVLVVGAKEQESKTVAVRTRDGKQTVQALDKFLENALKENAEKK